jgi:hypothetical protein
MDHGDDQRTAELNSLRLALVTFALQLDAFELRLKGRRHHGAALPCDDAKAGYERGR